MTEIQALRWVGLRSLFVTGVCVGFGACAGTSLGVAKPDAALPPQNSIDAGALEQPEPGADAAVVMSPADAGEPGSMGDAGIPLSTDAGQQATVPDRLVIFYVPHGTVLANWRPMGVGANFALSPILKPLAAFKDKLLTLDGVTVAVPRERSEGPPFFTVNHDGPGLPFSGTFKLANVPAPRPTYWPDSPTVDQLIANAIGQQTPVKRVGIGISLTPSLEQLSFSGSLQPAVAYEGVKAAVPALINGCKASGPAAERMNALAAAEASLNPLQTLNVETRTGLALSLVKEAFSIDCLRVATVHVGEYVRVPSLGGTINDIAHSANAAELSSFTAFQTRMAELLASFASDLKTVQQADGKTLFDHTVVVWVTDTDSGYDHDAKRLPMVILGDASGKLKTGQALMTNRNIVDVWLTLSNVYGLKLNQFGDPKLRSVVFPELLNP